jgi:hypothetical protein
MSDSKQHAPEVLAAFFQAERAKAVAAGNTNANSVRFLAAIAGMVAISLAKCAAH